MHFSTSEVSMAWSTAVSMATTLFRLGQVQVDKHDEWVRCKEEMSGVVEDLRSVKVERETRWW